MLQYYRRLGKVVWADFSDSTGEQVVGLLLAIGILLYQIHYGIIKPGEIGSNLLSVAWPYALLIMGLFLRHLIKAPYKMDLQRHAKQAELENLITSKDSLIKRLTQPEKRPRISPFAWGRVQMQFLLPGDTEDCKFGFYLQNDGEEPALNVKVEPFKISSDIEAASTPVGSIGPKTKGFIPIYLPNQYNVAKWGLNVAMGIRWKEYASEGIDPPPPVIISVVYQDFTGNWYRTRSYMKIHNITDIVVDRHIEFYEHYPEFLGPVNL